MAARVTQTVLELKKRYLNIDSSELKDEIDIRLDIVVDYKSDGQYVASERLNSYENFIEFCKEVKKEPEVIENYFSVVEDIPGMHNIPFCSFRALELGPIAGLSDEQIQDNLVEEMLRNTSSLSQERDMMYKFLEDCTGLYSQLKNGIEGEKINRNWQFFFYFLFLSLRGFDLRTPKYIVRFLEEGDLLGNLKASGVSSLLTAMNISWITRREQVSSNSTQLINDMCKKRSRLGRRKPGLFNLYKYLLNNAPGTGTAPNGKTEEEFKSMIEAAKKETEGMDGMTNLLLKLLREISSDDESWPVNRVSQMMSTYFNTHLNLPRDAEGGGNVENERIGAVDNDAQMARRNAIDSYTDVIDLSGIGDGAIRVDPIDEFKPNSADIGLEYAKEREMVRIIRANARLNPLMIGRIVRAHRQRDAETVRLTYLPSKEIIEWRMELFPQFLDSIQMAHSNKMLNLRILGDGFGVKNGEKANKCCLQNFVFREGALGSFTDYFSDHLQPAGIFGMFTAETDDFKTEVDEKVLQEWAKGPNLRNLQRVDYLQLGVLLLYKITNSEDVLEKDYASLMRDSYRDAFRWNSRYSMWTQLLDILLWRNAGMVEKDVFLEYFKWAMVRHDLYLHFEGLVFDDLEEMKTKRRLELFTARKSAYGVVYRCKIDNSEYIYRKAAKEDQREIMNEIAMFLRMNASDACPQVVCMVKSKEKDEIGYLMRRYEGHVGQICSHCISISAWRNILFQIVDAVVQSVNIGVKFEGILVESFRYYMIGGNYIVHFVSFAVADAESITTADSYEKGVEGKGTPDPEEKLVARTLHIIHMLLIEVRKHVAERIKDAKRKFIPQNPSTDSAEEKSASSECAEFDILCEKDVGLFIARCNNYGCFTKAKLIEMRDKLK